jgi:hypothetical protein
MGDDATFGERLPRKVVGVSQKCCGKGMLVKHDTLFRFLIIRYRMISDTQLCSPSSLSVVYPIAKELEVEDGA